ncbi:MAG: hypothetical protein RBU21_18345 [FCB group bacterium]|nr:hypothetical protein [FCB group bacterium]
MEGKEDSPGKRGEGGKIEVVQRQWSGVTLQPSLQLGGKGAGFCVRTLCQRIWILAPQGETHMWLRRIGSLD